jgi:hypothetical protein
MQHLYISYPPNDYQFAHRLVDDLQAAGYIVFVDAVSETGTFQWAAETRHAIRTCGAVLMVLSPLDGRRMGIRHEGVLAKRRQKPVYALLRSPGDLPRYLTDSIVIDFSGDYGAALEQLMGSLPNAATLLAAETPGRQRRLRRPPRQQTRADRLRQLLWVAGLLIVITLCVIAGIVLA